MNSFEIVEKKPGAADLHALRQIVRFTGMDVEAVERGLDGSLYAVCAVSGEELIGCARVVGDGAAAFYVQDVIVHPSWQGHGVGRALMEKVMGFIEAHACPGAVVGLMCAKGKDKFYEKFGFWARPNDRYGPGMMQFWKRDV